MCDFSVSLWFCDIMFSALSSLLLPLPDMIPGSFAICFYSRYICDFLADQVYPFSFCVALKPSSNWSLFKRVISYQALIKLK